MFRYVLYTNIIPAAVSVKFNVSYKHSIIYSKKVIRLKNCYISSVAMISACQTLERTLIRQLTAGRNNSYNKLTITVLHQQYMYTVKL